MMNRFPHNVARTAAFAALVLTGLGTMSSCLQKDDYGDFVDTQQQKVNFDVLVTRDGKLVSRSGSGVTRSDVVTSADNLATMNDESPFGLVATDAESGNLLVDNKMVYGNGSNYSAYFDHDMWGNARRINFSAYYPYVGSLAYGTQDQSYSIPYSVKETEAGPLVSKTAQKAVELLSMIPLEFQHITNDIGFKICDVTPMEELQGLIHLRRLTVANVASAGTFVQDIAGSKGVWKRQGYYRKVVVFDGDAKVGVGSENEKFVGSSTLEDSMAASHRYYSVPDEIEIGKQYVEVVFDVEGFEHGGFHYPPLTEQVFKYMLYGLLPNNEFAYGKQYTFHIGLDLSSIYKQITFAPSVGDWETKIYENNEDF